MLREQVVPQIAEGLPSVLRGGFRLGKFTLGQAPPELGHIAFHSLAGGAKLKTEIAFDSSSSVDIALELGAHVGVQSVKFRGTVVVRLGPFVDEVPVVAGVSVYLLDRPSLELDFTGIGNIADAPGVAGMVRRTIGDAIAGALVLPNMISVPVGTEAQGVDRALLEKPAPLGVMRVTVLRAANLLGKDFRLLGSATSDPYVKVRLSEEEWRSSTVQATCNPVWKDDDYHDFFVWDAEQHFAVEVYDADRFSSDDLLGVLRPIAAQEAPGMGDAVLPLLAGSEQCKPSESSASDSRGSLELRFEWFELLPQAVGTEGAVVTLRIKHLLLPASMRSKVSVSVGLGGVERSTAPVNAASRPAASAGVDAIRCEIARRCGESGLDHATIAKVTDLGLPCVERLLVSGKEAGGSKLDLAEPEFVQVDAVVHIPQFRAAFDLSSPLTFALRDRKGRALGTASVALHGLIPGAGLPEPASVPLELPGGGASGAGVLAVAAVHGLSRSPPGHQEFHIGSLDRACSEGCSPWR